MGFNTLFNRYVLFYVYGFLTCTIKKLMQLYFMGVYFTPYFLWVLLSVNFTLYFIKCTGYTCFLYFTLFYFFRNSEILKADKHKHKQNGISKWKSSKEDKHIDKQKGISISNTNKA